MTPNRTTRHHHGVLAQLVERPMFIRKTVLAIPPDPTKFSMGKHRNPLAYRYMPVSPLQPIVGGEFMGRYNHGGFLVNDSN